MKAKLDGDVRSLRKYIADESWAVDESHPDAEILRRYTVDEKTARDRPNRALRTRLTLGQLDRATYRLCTRSPGGFPVDSALRAAHDFLRSMPSGADGSVKVFRLAAVLAEAVDDPPGR